MSWNATQTTLGDETCFRTLNGLWKGKKPPFVEAGVIRNTNFTESGRIDFDNIAWLEVEEKQLAKRQLEAGDIIIERSGGGPKQPVGRVVFFDRNDGRFSFSNFTSAIRVGDRAAFDAKFVFYSLLELYQSGQTEDLQRRTTGIRNLDFSAYKERAVFPRIPLAEQRKIEGVLGLVQRAMEQQERLIRKTAELKKTLLHQLFTQGTRGEPQKQTDLGPVPESWEVVKLGALFQIKHGYAFAGEFFRESGRFVLCTPGHFHEEGGFRDRGEKTKYYVGDFPSAYVLQKGDLLVAMTEQTEGLLGSTALIPESGRFLHNQRLGLIQDLNEARLLKGFLFYVLNTVPVRKRISMTSSGSKVRHTSPGKIRDVLVALPPLKEQMESVKILEAVDQKLAHHRRKHATLSALFRTLLHQLMTAQLRVHDLDLPELGTDSPPTGQIRTFPNRNPTPTKRSAVQ